MEVNPLNVLEQRKLDWLPSHFFTVKIQDSNSQALEKLGTWIWKNCRGRFCIVNTLQYNTVEVGFEIGNEASYFALIHPTIK